MTGILLPCRRCGRQVYSSAVRDGMCLDCRVDASLADLREEHLRLWRKRERYQGRGANVDSISRQIARLEDRMAHRIGSRPLGRIGVRQRVERVHRRGHLVGSPCRRGDSAAICDTTRMVKNAV